MYYGGERGYTTRKAQLPGATVILPVAFSPLRAGRVSPVAQNQLLAVEAHGTAAHTGFAGEDIDFRFTG